MNTTRHLRTRLAAAVTTATVTLAACGGSTSDSEPNANRNASGASISEANNTTAVTTPASTAATSASSTTTPPTTAAQASSTQPEKVSQVPPALQAQVDVLCDPTRFVGVPMTGGDPQRVGELLEFVEGVRTATPPIDSLDVPPELSRSFDLVRAAATSADEAFASAQTAAASGDLVAADDQINRYFAHLRSTSGRLALMGATCGLSDPARAAAADLNVPLDLDADQISAGFGSVWVSQEAGGTVVRVDPVTGEILATVDVGDDPLKLQPADGRMWVRTADSYVAIDADTNEVVATLEKADVGPAANRNYAVDGAMWICDGPRLHRYDIATLQSVASIDLAFDCAFVVATEDLVIAWNDNDDAGESGQSAAAFVDPNGSRLLATVTLPIDVGWPVVLPDAVFFGGDLNDKAVVIDPAPWTVRETIELPDRVGGGGGIVADDTSIYLPTHGNEPFELLVLDAKTFDVIDTLTPLNVNAAAVTDGAVWVTHPSSNVLQRFDVDG